MKTRIKLGLLSAVLLASACLSHAELMVNPANTTTYTNLAIPSTVTAGSTSNFVSQPFTVLPGKTVGFEAVVACAAASLSNVTFKVSGSIDGTNFATAGGGYVTLPTLTLNGTNDVRWATNWPANYWGGYKRIRVEQIVNGDSAQAITPKSVRLSRDN